MEKLFLSSGAIKSYRHGDSIECVVNEAGGDIQYDIPFEQNNKNIVFRGPNAIDFLGRVYSKTNEDDPKYFQFLRWLNRGTTERTPRCWVYKKLPEAKTPSKERLSDVGYDLTIVKPHKKLSETTTLYDTGISVQVETGFYAEVIPRSSISKSGYMLANGTGIIDPSYTGSIMVALTKIDPSAPDLELPFRCCQLIFRQQVHVDIVEDYPSDCPTTTRGTGGFGSTGQ
jgi:dUTP pyrophosphatase